MDIIKQLTGGDRRSIGEVEQVVAVVLRDVSLFAALIAGLEHVDEVVRMRSADAVEKISRDRPELLKPYKNKLINEVAHSEQQEVRWHLAQIFPRLQLTAKQKQQVVDILLSYYKKDNSIIVKTFSLQALFDLATNDDNLTKTVLRLAKQACKTGKPALQSRAKKLLRFARNDDAAENTFANKTEK